LKCKLEIERMFLYIIKRGASVLVVEIALDDTEIKYIKLDGLTLKNSNYKKKAA